MFEFQVNRQKKFQPFYFLKFLFASKPRIESPPERFNNSLDK